MAERQHDKCTVFVRGVSFDAGDDDFSEFFSDIGPVKQAFLVKRKGAAKHKGFGFVHFALHEDAERAAAELNGKELKGRKLQVRHVMHGLVLWVPGAGCLPATTAHQSHPAWNQTACRALLHPAVQACKERTRPARAAGGGGAEAGAAGGAEAEAQAAAGRGGGCGSRSSRGRRSR